MEKNFSPSVKLLDSGSILVESIAQVSINNLQIINTEGNAGCSEAILLWENSLLVLRRSRRILVLLCVYAPC